MELSWGATSFIWMSAQEGNLTDASNQIRNEPNGLERIRIVLFWHTLSHHHPYSCTTTPTPPPAAPAASSTPSAPSTPALQPPCRAIVPTGRSEVGGGLRVLVANTHRGTIHHKSPAQVVVPPVRRHMESRRAQLIHAIQHPAHDPPHAPPPFVSRTPSQ